eukprot:scaffold101119_cov31-Tisochrysis_lutea.AAC.3
MCGARQNTSRTGLCKQFLPLLAPFFTRGVQFDLRQRRVPLSVKVVHVQPEWLGIGQVEEWPLLTARVSEAAVLEPIVKDEGMASLHLWYLGTRLQLKVKVRARNVLRGPRAGMEVDERHKDIDGVERGNEALVAVREHMWAIRVPRLYGRPREGQHTPKVGELSVSTQGGVHKRHPWRPGA